MLVPANAVHAHPRPLAAAFAIVVALALPAKVAQGNGHGHDPPGSATSSSSTRRTTPSTTSTAAGRACAARSTPSARARSRSTRPGRPTLPAAERREPHVAAAAARCTDKTTPTPFASHFPNAPFGIDALVRHRDDVPAARRVAPNGVPPAPGCRRLHARPGAPLLPGAVPARRRPAGPLRHRQRRPGAHHGRLRHRPLPIYEYLHRPGHPRYAIADNLFQAAFGGSFLNHQWLIAAATPSWPGARRRLRRRPALRRRRERHAVRLSVYTPPGRGQGRGPHRLLRPGRRAAARPRASSAATTRSTRSSPSPSLTRRAPGRPPPAAPDARRRSATGSATRT